MRFSSLLATCALVLTRGYITNGQSLDSVCALIDQSTSSATLVSYPGDPLGLYDEDISHWALSSTQPAACSVRPATSIDVAAILRIVGSTRTPFAVKGGGHASNPGFSSTTGVQINMELFAEVTYDVISQTVVIGSGLVWDDVYGGLEPYNVTVVGGRVSGVGVAGFTLGGGYSFLTNQHGLTIDTVVAFELVQPSGIIELVTEASNPALFFGLKGGFNNFAGIITFVGPEIPAATAAIAAFASSVDDPKAATIAAYNFAEGEPNIVLLVFYDAATPPAGIFDDIIQLPSAESDVSTRRFSSFVSMNPTNGTPFQRAIFNSVSLVEYTPTLLDAILNETVFWGTQLTPSSAFLVSYDVEPFLPSLFSHAPEFSSAYPASRARGLSPFNIYYAWVTNTTDDIFHDAIKQSAAQIQAVAIAEGQDLAGLPLYPNYAIYDTPLEDLYGQNVPALRALKAVVDPTNVMGLAGGFKF